MKKMSRVLTLVLALAICFSCMAMSVFAADCPNADKDDSSKCACTAEEKENCNCADTCTCKQQGGACYVAPVVTPGEVQVLPPSTEVCGTSAKARPFVADVSGKYRTSTTKILKTVTTVAIATAMEDEQLVIDPVTNTVGNMYDSEGNLIPCTLSSDGHFIIVPTNEGYAYIPTGK